MECQCADRVFDQQFLCLRNPGESRYRGLQGREAAWRTEASRTGRHGGIATVPSPAYPSLPWPFPCAVALVSMIVFLLAGASRHCASAPLVRFVSFCSSTNMHRYLRLDSIHRRRMTHSAHQLRRCWPPDEVPQRAFPQRRAPVTNNFVQRLELDGLLRRRRTPPVIVPGMCVPSMRPDCMPHGRAPSACLECLLRVYTPCSCPERTYPEWVLRVHARSARPEYVPTSAPLQIRPSAAGHAQRLCFHCVRKEQPICICV